MKRYFLACILFLGITSFASAGAAHTTTNNTKTLIRERSKKEKRSLSSTAARKKRLAARKSSKKHSSSHLRKVLASKKAKNSKLRIPKADLISLKSESNRELSADEIKMGDDFASNRGKLPWPVDGSVSLPFGLYKIDGTNIRGNSPGIMFSTPDNTEQVKAVFDGVVSSVDTKGEVTTVCIRHGKYSTVYGNLTSINVNKGDLVKKNQVIATIGDGYNAAGGELTFLLMVDNNNVNPAPWLNH